MSLSVGQVSIPIQNEVQDASPQQLPPSSLLTPPQSPYFQSNSNEELLKINCILLGDEKIGKSCIASTYIAPGGGFRQTYEPTTREEYAVEKELDDALGHHHKIVLNIVDTGGQKDLDRLRPLCYNQANVFILCFSVVVPSSFQSVMRKWIPEIKRHTDHQTISLFLVGTQSDLRSNTTVLIRLSKDGKSPVSESSAISLSGKIGAKNYIECSAVTRKNIRQIFDYVMISSVFHSGKGTDYESLTSADVGAHRHCGLPRTLNCDKENKAYGKKGRQLLRQLLSKKWNVRKCYKTKRIIFFSCLFN